MSLSGLWITGLLQKKQAAGSGADGYRNFAMAVLIRIWKL